MSHINWGFISNGFEFQALCNSLLGYEFPSIEQFSAPGPDGGVDGYLPSALAIYQYKYSQTPSKTKVKQDALDELAKVAGRRSKGGRYWTAAKKWVLVTNCETNPQLLEMWETEVVPAFAKEGLTALLVPRERLEELLIQHPVVMHAFFEKINRSFVTLNEAIEGMKSRRIQDKDLENTFVGRNEELNTFRNFLEDGSKSLLIISGAGGVGKSRMLLECAKVAASEYQLSVYWANTETMESSSNWAVGIPTGKNVILFIDEPTKPQTMRVLLEQVQSKNSSFSQWKVVISARAQNAEITEALTQKREEFLRTILELRTLTETELTSVAAELLAASPVAKEIGTRMNEIAGAVGRASQGYPIWAVVATRLIQDKGSFIDLPKDHWAIAKDHIQQAISSIPESLCGPKQALNLLNWLSLFKEIYIDDHLMIEFLKAEIGEKDQFKVIEIVEAFIERKVIHAAGRKRRIKPDVIRDALLVSQLVSDRKASFTASAFAKDLCKRILSDENPVPQLESVISSLNHVELLQKLNNHPIELLTPIVSQLRDLAIKGSSIQQYSALELAKKFAYSRPRELLAICNAIRETKTEPSEITDSVWGKRFIEHKATMLELPWTILEAARYALEPELRKVILEELVRLAEYERSESSENPIQPNDGKRAHQVFEKIIFNGPGFYVRFDHEAESVANKILDTWKSAKGISDGESYALKSLVGPLISIEREYTVFAKGTISINRYVINPDQPIYDIRSRLLEKLWNLLDSSMSEDVRIAVLDLLQENHRNTHNGAARSRSRQGMDRYQTEALADLKRIQVFLNCAGVSGLELRKARQLWDWHLNYDSREDYKSLAEECEKIFLSRPNAVLFSRVFEWRYHQDEDSSIAAKELAIQVSQDISGKAIEQMVTQAMEFAGQEKFWHGASLISEELGTSFRSSHAAFNFTWKNLNSSDSIKRSFSAAILSHHLRYLRTSHMDPDQEKILNQAIASVGDVGVYTLLTDLYRQNFGLTGQLNQIDFSIFSSRLDIFLARGNQIEAILIAAKFMHLGWGTVMSIVEKCLETLEGEALTKAVSVAIDSIHMQLNFHKELPLSRENAKWIFGLLTRVPKIEDCGSKVEWDLQQISKKSGFKFSLSEFAEFLENRICLAANSSESGLRFDILPSRVMFNLFQFVNTISNLTADKAETEKTVLRLLALNDSPDPVGYYLPEWVVALDPLGELVPDLVVENLESVKETKDIEKVRSWSRYASEYFETTPPWRKIALSVAKFASSVSDPKEKNSLLWSIAYKEMEGWSGTYGEFHPRWQEAVDREEKRVQEETDDHLKEFFQLKLRAAKSDLAREKLLHTEEHDDE